MRTDLLLDQFDTLLTTPDDVAHLRTAIFQLAVEGKLVLQDSADEPATELLKHIQVDREQLLREKKIRKTKPLPPIEDNEIPYELPKNWVWVRLSEIGLINPRNEADDDLEASFVPMPLIPTEYGEAHTSEKRLWGEIRSGYTHFQENDVVVAKITPCFQNRKSVVMRDLINGIGAGTTELHVFRGNPEHILPDYVLVFFKTLSFIQGGRNMMTGTAGQQRVPKNYVIQIPFPLPPVAEQKRIVAKVDALLAQTRALAAQLEQADAALVPAAQAAFQSLLDAQNTTVQHEAWQRIADHFDTLTSDPRTIDALKQTVLQLAVQGKLVPQGPNDEPATELLKRIQAEKTQLVQEKKIRKPKPLPPIKDDEIPYILPSGWEWVRVGDIANCRLGKMLDKHKNKGEYFPYLRNLNVQWLRINLDDVLQMRFESHEIEEYKLEQGDLLICEGGEPGRCAIWEHSNLQMMFQKAIHRVRPFGGIMPKYLLYHIWADARDGVLNEYFTGATIKHFTGKALASYIFALPPLAEQKRIVAKVEALLALCDALAAEVAAAEEVRGWLLRAVLNGG